MEVNKSSQAKLQDGGTTGTVNIITRKPLEFSKPFTAEGSIGLVRSDQAKSNDPQYSALFNKNDEGTFGVMVRASARSANCAVKRRKSRVASSRSAQTIRSPRPIRT